jgi:hypothetical protein
MSQGAVKLTDNKQPCGNASKTKLNQVYQREHLLRRRDSDGSVDILIFYLGSETTMENLYDLN